ncbi:MAG: hypothetical protein RR779_15925 [Comamonas sp.]
MLLLSGILRPPTRRIALGLALLMSLSACVTRPKPQYHYAGAPDDPVFFLDSDFGIDTGFTAQINPVKSSNLCKNRQGVAYMQSMDSYYRDSSLKGPWKIVAPAGEPLVISGGWFQYATMSTNYSPLGARVTSPARGCSAENKLVVGEKGKQYRAYLYKSKDGGCALEITSVDGSPIEATPYPKCTIR